MRPSSTEAARALASLLAAAFPDRTPDGSSASAGADGSVGGSISGREGSPSASLDGSGASTHASNASAHLPLAPPTPTTRASTSTYTPLPTRSGRVPQPPRPEDVDHSTLLFNEYLNYEWGSDDDDDDPDFAPTSEAWSAGDIFVGAEHGDGMDVTEENGDFSNDEGETDFSTMEDAWMQDDAASTFTGDTLDPTDFTSDITIAPVASTSTLPPSLPPPPLPASTDSKKPRATRAASAAAKGKGRQVDAPPPATKKSPTPKSASSGPRSRKRQGAPSRAPSPVPTPDASTPSEKPPTDGTTRKGPGRPRKYFEQDDVAARKERNRRAAAESREKLRIKAEQDKQRLELLEVENATLRDRVLELETLVEERKRRRKADEDGRVDSSGDGRRRGKTRARERERDTYSKSGESGSSGDESDGTVKSGRVPTALQGMNPDGLAELARLLSWAAKAGGSGTEPNR